MNPTELNPAAFPIGSAESRAAARLLASSRRPLEMGVPEDESGDPIWNESAVYGPTLRTLPRSVTREEWDREYGSPEAREGMYRRGELREANRAAWRAAYAQLLAECGGRVPGSLAAARIPKGKSVWASGV